jgi:hypothetical protein
MEDRTGTTTMKDRGKGLSFQGLPDVAEVAAVAALADPVLRNLRITQCYAELSVGLTARLPGAANWCTFATWASRQAGRTIRGEDLEAVLDGTLDEWLGEGGADAVAHALRALGAHASVSEIRAVIRRVLDAKGSVSRASAAVARGNLKVFEEIAREFARFHETLGIDEAPDGDRLAGFLAELRPGEPPAGQQLLRQAFGRYYRAFFDDDDRVRAQRVLHANLEVGLHEQTRLQPEIAEALNAAIPDARQLIPELLAVLLPARGLFARARRFATRLFGGRTPLDRAAEVAVDEARRRLRGAITDHLMTLELTPRHPLRLGRDLAVPYPEALARLEDAELIDLLARIDPTPDSVRESGARDWAALPERMHFIADLFRCYHATVELFDPPFSEEQLDAIRAGRIPAGRI